MLKKWNLQQVLVCSLAIIVWVNNFHSNTKNMSYFEQLFCEGNDIARGSNRGGCWEVQDELNIGV